MIQGGWTQDVELWTWRADFRVLYRFSAVCGVSASFPVLFRGQLYCDFLFFLYNVLLCNGAMWCCQFLVIQFSYSLSHVQLFETLWTAAHQASLSTTNSQSLLKFRWSCQWSHQMISSSVISFSSLLQSFPEAGWIQMSQFASGAQRLEFQLYHHSFQRNPWVDLLQNGLVGSPCSPRDSQESSPTSHFKSINSSVPSFLHSPTLTSIHDHWKNHSLD